MTKCIQRIRDLFDYALYKFTLYFTLLTELGRQRETDSQRQRQRDREGEQTTCAETAGSVSQWMTVNGRPTNKYRLFRCAC